MAKGDELLIVESVASHREGMRTLFEEAGYVCTAPAAVADAVDLATQKFFPAAVVSLDLDRPAGGIDLVRSLRERSVETGVVLLAGRRSFESALDAMRLGVVDIVMKRPDQVEYLKNAVELACDRYRADGEDQVLMEGVGGVLEEAFRNLMAMARQVYADVHKGSEAPPHMRVLIVDGDADFAQELRNRLQDRPWDVAVEMSGGAALDLASDRRFDLIACRDELMDLKGTLVVKSLQAVQADAAGVVYTAPGGEGCLHHYKEGLQVSVDRPFSGVDQLVQAFDTQVLERSQTERDRRIIRAFRADHEDFLRRYAALKLRIDRILMR